MDLDKLFHYTQVFYKFAENPWWKEKPPAQPKGAALPESFWIKFVEMTQRMGVNPYDLAAIIQSESGFNPTNRTFAAGPNRPPVAQGLSQFIRSTALNMLKMSEDTWRYFAWMPAEEQLKWVEKYFGNRAKGRDAGSLYLMNFGGFPNPDGSLYAGLQAQQKWIAEHPEDAGKFKNPQYQQKAVEQNPGFVRNDKIMPETVKARVQGGIKNTSIRKRIAEAVQAIGGKEPPPYQEPNPNWSPGKQNTQSPTATNDISEQEANQLLQLLWK